MFDSNRRNHGLIISTFLLVPLLLLGMTGCERQEKVVSKSAIISELDVWMHTGNKDALLLIKDQVARFNANHSRIQINLTSIPKGTYNAQINAAISTNTMPDIVELDGPYIAGIVERGGLIKLDKLLTDTARQDMLPAIYSQGMYQGRLYSLATSANSWVMYARKSAIEAAGYPAPVMSKDAWNLTVFEALLASLMKRSDFSAAIDLGLQQQGEQLSNALYPILRSFGGGMIDEDRPLDGMGVLNSEQNIAALSHIQRWIRDGYVDKNSDGKAFISGRVALSWDGLDKYDLYQQQFGDDLVVVPLPDFGAGSYRTQRAWGWGLTRNCEDTQAAMRLLEFLLQPDEVLLAAEANATFPATYSALARFDTFNETPSFSDLIEEQKRGDIFFQPQSPLYSVISEAFQKAVVRIRKGEDIESSLNSAAKIVDEAHHKFDAELNEVASLSH